MSAEQNKTVVRRLIEDVWGRGNVNLLRDLTDPDIRDENPMPGQPCGQEGQRWAVETLTKAFSNANIKLDDLLADGDHVLDRWTFTGTHTGSFAGMSPTGRKFTITGSDLMRLRNGKVEQIYHVEDNLGLMRQLGAAPPAQMPQSFGQRNTSTGRSGQTDSGKQLSPQEQKGRLQQAFRELLEQGNLNRIDEYIHPDYVGHYAGFPTVYGRDGFRQFLSIYTQGLSNRRPEVNEMLVDGDKAGCRVIYTGKNTGEMFDMPPTGRAIRTDAISWFRFAGDKVIEQWQFNDDLRMLQQLGVVPEMAGMPAAQPC